MEVMDPLSRRELDEIDTLFGNEPTRFADEAFYIEKIGKADEVSVMMVARLDLRLTSLIEDLKREKTAPSKGGIEPTVLKEIFKLLPIATASLLKYCGSLLARELEKRKTDLGED